MSDHIAGTRGGRARNRNRRRTARSVGSNDSTEGLGAVGCFELDPGLLADPNPAKRVVGDRPIVSNESRHPLGNAGARGRDRARATERICDAEVPSRPPERIASGPLGQNVNCV